MNEQDIRQLVTSILHDAGQEWPPSAIDLQVRLLTDPLAVGFLHPLIARRIRLANRIRRQWFNGE